LKDAQIASAPNLRAENLTKAFGGLRAVDDVSLSVAPYERRAIIGPNGAGKTTLFNLLSGEIPPLGGRVFLNEREITRLAVYERARLGLGRTYQRNSLFPNLTVLDNVRLAVQARLRVERKLLRPVGAFGELTMATREVLERFSLADYAQSLVRELSYGMQRQMEVTLALARGAQVLLLDEPTAGMSPGETRALVDMIREMPRDATLLIIEHDMDVVFELADSVTVLHLGRVIAEGAPEQVKGNREVRDIYLGGP
jgi:branched-chain amino acid transport system ATP-binding protein